MEFDSKHMLERYLSGDIEALGALVEEYRRPLYGFILKMTEGRADADEVFQEVWFRAINKIDSFKGGNFLSWLFRITHNLIIDTARKNRRFSDPPPDRDEGSVMQAQDNLPDVSLGPDVLVEDADTGKIIRDALQSLPLEQREVFIMRVDAELPFKEIARIQRVSINTALARMQYALEKLRNELDGFYHSRRF